MKNTIPSDLIPIETAGNNTGKGYIFFLVAAAREEIKLFRPSGEGFFECSTSHIKMFLDNGSKFYQNFPQIHSNKSNGPIESLNTLYISESESSSLLNTNICDKKDLNKSLLKLVGALIEIHYAGKSKYMKGETINASAIKEDIHTNLAKKNIDIHGIQDRAAREKIKESYQLFTKELPDIILAAREELKN